MTSTLGFLKGAEKFKIPPGKMKSVSLGGKEVLIANVGGTFYAIGSRCTHQGGDLSKGTLDGNTVKCPRHGSQFDVTTGRLVSGPKMLFMKLKARA